MTDKDSLESIQHMGLHPDDEEIARQCMQGDMGWIWDVSGERAEAFGSGLLNGYLKWPRGAGFSLPGVYLMDRMFRGRTGVALCPSREARWQISAYCFGPAPLPQLQTTAERVGVEVDFTKPEEGRPPAGSRPARHTTRRNISLSAGQGPKEEAGHSLSDRASIDGLLVEGPSRSSDARAC